MQHRWTQGETKTLWEDLEYTGIGNQMNESANQENNKTVHNYITKFHIMIIIITPGHIT